MSGSAPRPRAGIDAIHAYVAGSSKGSGMGSAIKLSSNESALGPSPAAIEAARAAAGDFTRYPDGGCGRLREAIAAAHGLEAERIVCGNGSGELLSLLVQCYVAPGDEVVVTAHTFALYEIAARAAGATIRVVPDPALKPRVDDILAVVTDTTRIVFLANPNNPTGTYLTRADVEALQAGLPARCLLVLDGAYAEYVTAPDYDAGTDLVRRSANVVMTRTFSKIHALAALRVGWAYAPEPVCETLNKVRGPFNVNGVAQAAAIAALADRDHAVRALEENETWRAWLTDRLRERDIDVVPSHANFVLARFSDMAEATRCNDLLRSRNILVRPTASFDLPDSLRITVGPEEDMRRLVEGLDAEAGVAVGA